MGLLAPLYLLGILAVGVPILLHLIKRTPQGKQMFSTLMFLTPSPPRLTKRSRLTNILLLLIRALAVILLAIAFMRPFMNMGPIIESTNAGGHRVAILVDTSASMQRGDLWQQAQQRVDQALSELSGLDEVGLYFFDSGVKAGFSFNEWEQADVGSRVALLKARMAATKPGWAGTRQGDAVGAMIEAVEQGEEKNAASKLDRYIVLVTDNQQGSHLESLQGHQWPKDLRVVRNYVTPSTTGNASLQWIPQSSTEKSDGTIRVKVSNERDSTREQLTLSWATPAGVVPGVEPEKVYVAPGQSRIVKMTMPEQVKPDRIVLAGDSVDFDNTLYLAEMRIERVKVLYLGPDDAGDVNGLRYFLESALTDTSRRQVEIIGRKATDELTDADLSGVRLAVVGTMADRPQGGDAGQLSVASAERLRKFVDDGGDVLWVIRDLGSATPLAALLGEQWKMDEMTGDHAILSRIDVTHPMFAPFADVRFGDFTKIRFWRHRRVTLPAAEGAQTPTGVLAWFDNGDPFMIERLIGTKGGRVRVMTSGWNTSDSQFALSTKFVPVIERILRRKDEVVIEPQYFVGQPIALPEAESAAGRAIIQPNGNKVALGTSNLFAATELPGIYRLDIGGTQSPIAVNVAPDESRTAPFADDEITKWGAQIGKVVTAAETAEKERRERSTDLENRQKLWRWLIVIVLALLGLETLLAGRIARRSLPERAVT